MLRTHVIRLSVLCAAIAIVVAACKSHLTPPAVDATQMQHFDYDIAWKKIDSLEGKGLYQSALKATHEILHSAISEHNEAQQLKGLIFINKYAAHLNEDGLIEAIHGFESALQDAKGVQRALLLSMTAELYRVYLQNHAWVLRDRTDIPGEPGEDIRTWSVRHFIDKINAHYLSSVGDPALKQVPVDSYQLILTSANTDSLRPTLYDFVAHRAIDYFMQDYSFITEPVYAFKLTDLAYLDPARQFVDREIDSPDARSYKRRALELMQEVIAFHLDDADPAALVDADLKRLRFVYQQMEHEAKDTAYIRALDQLSGSNREHQIFTEIAYHRAQFYTQQGNSSEADESKWDLRTALEICEAAVEAYPGSFGAANCRNLITQLRQRHLSSATEKVWLPGDNPLVQLQYRNTNRAFLRVVQLSHEDREMLNSLPSDDIRSWLLGRDVLESKVIDFTGAEDLRMHSTEVGLTALPMGFYALVISGSEAFAANDAITAYAFFHVSDLAFWNAAIQGENRFVIVSRSSGAPVSGASVEFFTHEYNPTARTTELRSAGNAVTSDDGIVDAPRVGEGRRSDLLLKITNGEDVLFLQDGFYTFRYHQEPRPRGAAHVFTDRAIYRPGQKIHFKAYLMQFDEKQMPTVAANVTTSITLFDANGQKVEDVQLTSNAYGTLSGSFIAPEGRLLGNMRISSMDPWPGSTSLRVEEYKRPTFEVKIDSSDEAVSLNDTIQVRGQAMTFAGVPLDNASVNYRVVRRTYMPYYPWWMRGRWLPPAPEMEIAFGETQTSGDGSFAIEFFARSDAHAFSHFHPEFVFTVEADITDIAGETRSATKEIILGELGFRVDTRIAEYMDLGALDTLVIRAENLNGEALALTGSVEVEKLETPERPLRERRWEVPDEPVLTGAEYTEAFPAYAIPGQERIDQWRVMGNMGSAAFNVQGDDQVDISQLLDGAGAYKITLHFRSSSGDTLSQTHYVHCFDAAANSIPAYQLIQQKESARRVKPGEVYTLTLFSAESLHLYQYVDRMDGLSAGWSAIANGASERRLSIGESDRGGLSLQTAFVFDNRLHTSFTNVQVPWTNKALQIEYLSYRDVTEPGASEEWRIRIKGEKSDAVVAEMLGAMYDASLDAFVPHSWDMDLYPTNRSKLSIRGAGFDLADVRYLSWINERGYYQTHARYYRRLNWFNFPFYSRYLAARAPGVSLDAVESAAPELQEEVVVSALGNEADAAAKQEGSAVGGDANQTDSDVPPAVKIRSDLDETAFFFPHIRTDPDGTVTLRFTMKEALTRWKFLGLAHTQDLRYGFTEKEIVTRKNLMVFPNVPRFLRQKDTIHLSAKVFNTTDTALSGTVSLELLDAETGALLNARFGSDAGERSFNLSGQSSDAYEWEVQVPEDFTTPVKYRFIATTGVFGDGEEGLLPVLSDRIFVTESLAMYVHAESTKVYHFEALDKLKSSSLEPHGFALEFTTNPAWYAVQALPYLQEYPHACVEQRFSRLYANLLAGHLTSRFPAIRETYAQWKDDPTGESLMSSLSGNTDLKSALLEETPWVRDAMSEEEQMHNLAILFDEDRLASETSSTVQFLKQTQLTNGGFPWFAGGRDNWYITQYLVEGFGHLQKLGAFDINDYPGLRDVLGKAIAYCDTRASEHYAELQQRAGEGEVNLEDDNLSHIMTHYLYARSFFPDQHMSSATREVQTYYLQQSRQYWAERPLYLQGLIALSLSRLTESEEVAIMTQSFDERSLFDEELGRYWKAAPGYYWYQLPVEQQALMIEVFDELTGNREFVDELRLWLLNNKRTNRWETTKATASAIYALLLHSDNWLEGTPVKIVVGQEQVEQAPRIAGAEYIKQTWTADQIGEEFTEIRLENPNGHIAWGGAYFQYFEDLDKITSSTETPLQVAKSVWKEERTDRGPELRPVAPTQELAVGDKVIIRIELEVDRAMEFIHLKDMRGSGLEPINVLSSHKWQGGLGYYESTGDLATHFFMDRLPRGKWVFEYPLRVTHTGNYANGIATLQAMYAPEFSSHSDSDRLVVE